MPNFVTDPVE